MTLLHHDDQVGSSQEVRVRLTRAVGAQVKAESSRGFHCCGVGWKASIGPCARAADRPCLGLACCMEFTLGVGCSDRRAEEVSGAHKQDHRHGWLSLAGELGTVYYDPLAISSTLDHQYMGSPS
ncbi:MAG: hypothetical protein WAM09_11410 [Anaerolineales bacterium]